MQLEHFWAAATCQAPKRAQPQARPLTVRMPAHSPMTCLASLQNCWEHLPAFVSSVQETAGQCFEYPIKQTMQHLNPPKPLLQEPPLPSLLQ